MADASRPSNGAPILSTPRAGAAECAAEGCEASCTALTGFCGPHWRKLLPAAQRVLLHHRDQAAKRPTPPNAATHALAVRIAVILIAFLERRWSQRHCYDQIADACFQARRARVADGEIDVMVRAMGWEAIAKGHKPEPEQLVLGGGKKR
jgi:hypothetical protein